MFEKPILRTAVRQLAELHSGSLLKQQKSMLATRYFCAPAARVRSVLLLIRSLVVRCSCKGTSVPDAWSLVVLVARWLFGLVDKRNELFDGDHEVFVVASSCIVKTRAPDTPMEVGCA